MTETVNRQTTKFQSIAKIVVANSRQPAVCEVGSRYASSMPGLFVRPSKGGSVG